jgi:hypothetical protein
VKQLGIRLNEEEKTQFQIICLKKGMTMQRALEDYVKLLIELDIGPDDALAAIREAHKKPRK